MTILLTTSVHECRLDFLITVIITKTILLLLEYIQLEGHHCDDTYVTVYKTLSFEDEDEILHLCADVLIYNRELRSDWNTMGVLWYHSQMTGTSHVLAYYLEKSLDISESNNGSTVPSFTR